jgi:hypothetical protein
VHARIARPGWSVGVVIFFVFFFENHTQKTEKEKTWPPTTKTRYGSLRKCHVLLPRPCIVCHREASSHGQQEDLVDYEEAEETAAPAQAPAPKKEKGNHVSVHSATFKSFLLKDELLRSIADCGFEHPSEGCFFLPTMPSSASIDKKQTQPSRKNKTNKQPLLLPLLPPLLSPSPWTLLRSLLSQTSGLELCFHMC